MPKRKITIVNSSIEILAKEVLVLEDDTHYTLGSVKNTYWAHSLYAQFHDEIGISEPMFPILLLNFKPFLLELSKVYPYITLEAAYLNLRRAWLIIEKIQMIPPSQEITQFLKLLKINYGENIVGSKQSIASKRRPLLPTSVFKIVESMDYSSVGIRDSSLILVNMVIGQRCDSLQHVLVKHIEFIIMEQETGEKKVCFYISIIKEKEKWLEKERKRLVTPTLNALNCPVRFLLLWFWTRGIISTQFTTFDDMYNSNSLFDVKKEAQQYPCWCAIPHNIIENNSPHLSRDIGKRVNFNATNCGFEVGSITGHSMRKVTATAWMLNLIENKGTYSKEGF